MNTAERLRQAVAARGGSIKGFHEQLSKLAAARGVHGFSYTSVHSYLRREGAVSPSIEFLTLAAELLGVRAAWLGFGDGQMTELPAAPVAQGVDFDDLRRIQRLQDSNAVSATLLVGTFGGDRAHNLRLRAERLDAMLRFAQRLNDVNEPGTPWSQSAHVRRMLVPTLERPDPRSDLLAAAALFLVKVDRAFDEACEAWHSPLFDKPATPDYLDTILQRPMTAGARALWRDMILDLFATRVRGLGADPLPTPSGQLGAPTRTPKVRKKRRPAR